MLKHETPYQMVAGASYKSAAPLPYNSLVELASNLVWMFAAMSALGITAWAVRRGHARVSGTSALTLTFLICVLLLPVISMSDDLMLANQAELPLSAQTWRMAWEGASVGLEFVALLSACLLMLAFLAVRCSMFEEADREARPVSAWLTRAQRLRPPPSFAP